MSYSKRLIKLTTRRHTGPEDFEKVPVWVDPGAITMIGPTYDGDMSLLRVRGYNTPLVTMEPPELVARMVMGDERS